MAKNTWSAKINRTVTSVLPVSKHRNGQCRQCGACCHLPNRCFFLRKSRSGIYRCVIYPIRPLNCRKYPRSESEWITPETCGFMFRPDTRPGSGKRIRNWIRTHHLAGILNLLRLISMHLHSRG